MPTYFKPLRRRIGIYALLLACVIMAAWLRSIFFNDEATVMLIDRIHMVWSLQGGFIWLSHEARGDMALRWGSHDAKMELYGGTSQTEIAKSWREHFERLDRPSRVWTAHYSTIVIPLTLLSAWLLLSKPRVNPKPIAETP